MQSHVAGIVDEKGGVRLVVDGSRERIVRYHVGPGERVYFLPVRVREPVPLGQVAQLFEQVRALIGEGSA